MKSIILALVAISTCFSQESGASTEPEMTLIRLTEADKSELQAAQEAVSKAEQEVLATQKRIEERYGAKPQKSEACSKAENDPESDQKAMDKACAGTIDYEVSWRGGWLVITRFTRAASDFTSVFRIGGTPRMLRRTNLGM